MDRMECGPMSDNGNSHPEHPSTSAQVTFHFASLSPSALTGWNEMVGSGIGGMIPMGTSFLPRWPVLAVVLLFSSLPRPDCTFGEVSSCPLLLGAHLGC